LAAEDASLHGTITDRDPKGAGHGFYARIALFDFLVSGHDNAYVVT
jgi:hypothetical protein